MSGVVVWYAVLLLIGLIILWPFRRLPRPYAAPLDLSGGFFQRCLVRAILFVAILGVVSLATFILLMKTIGRLPASFSIPLYASDARAISRLCLLLHGLVIAFVAIVAVMAAGRPAASVVVRTVPNPLRRLPVRLILAAVFLAAGLFAYEYRSSMRFAYDLEDGKIALPELFAWTMTDPYDDLDGIAAIAIDAVDYDEGTVRIAFTVRMDDGRADAFLETRTLPFGGFYGVWLPTELTDLYVAMPDLFVFADADVEARFRGQTENPPQSPLL